MDYRIIREARLRDPFRPFRLITNKGRTFLIQEPYHLAVNQYWVSLVDINTGAGVPLLPEEVESLVYLDEPSGAAS